MNWLTKLFIEKVDENVSNATVKDLQITYTHVAKLEHAYGFNIEEIGIQIDNQNHSGYGQSTVDLCSRWNINSADVFKQLRLKGWIDANNELTLKGLFNSNDWTPDHYFDWEIDRVLFQQMAGGLYWNMAHPLFKTKWQGIVDACEHREFCAALKNQPQPFADKTKDLIKKSGMSLTGNENVPMKGEDGMG